MFLFKFIQLVILTVFAFCFFVPKEDDDEEILLGGVCACLCVMVVKLVSKFPNLSQISLKVSSLPFILHFVLLLSVKLDFEAS